MQTYARVDGGVAVEIINLPDGVAVGDAYHPDIAAAIVPCPADVEQGWTVSEDGEWSPPPLAEVDLAALKAGLKTAIDCAAEAERLQYITGGAGQAMEYQQAAAEAIALLSVIDADPEHVADPADYPMLAASIGIDGATLADVAATVAAMNRQWQVLGSAIRFARLAAKQAIDLAPDAEAARAVVPAWPN